MDLYYYIMFWICIVGLCVGSFLNVVILRSLSNESIVFPPSKCPKCNNRLKPWHNIPVLSYIILRGKCHFCKEKISIQYPIVEIITMVMFLLAYICFGISWTTLFMLFFFSCFIVMTITDLKEQLVDCNIAIAVGVAGLILNYIQAGWYGLLYSFLGLLVGVLVLEILARLGYLFVGTRAMGEADSYVAGALGAIFGLQNIFSVLLYGFIASMILIVPMFLYTQFKTNNKKTSILAILFILSVLTHKFLVQNFYTLGLLIVLAIVLSYTILKGIKIEENRTYFPYVPALVTGALYFIFFELNF